MRDSGNMSDPLKDRIFRAAQDELLRCGIDRFSIEGVARRAGVDTDVILRNWRDRRLLLMEAMLVRTTANRWSPDTGSVRTDFEAVSGLATELSQTAEGRAMFRRVLPSHDDVDLAEIRADLWDARFRDAAQILRRAAVRGQLRDGVAPEEAIRMFASAFYYDVIFNDSPVRPQYAEQVVDIFLSGILATPDRDRRWSDIEQLMSNPRPGEVGSAADQAVEAARRTVVLMRTWIDAFPDPLVLYEAVRDGGGRINDFVCRDLNRAACAEVGLPRMEAVGRSMRAALPNAGAAELIARYADCLESGEPLVLNDFSYLYFDQERRLDLRATPAAPELVTVTWRDVNETL